MNIESLQRIVLAIAQAQKVDAVLRLIVCGLAEETEVALARIWLAAPGDLCPSCHMQSACADQTCCLHLAASAGNAMCDEASRNLRARSWTSLDGYFRRVPLDAPLKVSYVSGTGQGVLIQIDGSGEKQDWIARPEWAKSEGILSFAGQPLVSKQNVLGVLGVFSRERLANTEFAWLRTFADHAAVAIVNAKGLEERERAESALRESERRMHAFWDNSPSSIFIKDPAGRYLYANKSFEKALGVDAACLRGKSDEEVFSDEQAASFRRHDQAVLRAGVPLEFEEVSMLADGPHTSIVHKFPLLDEKGEVYALGGVATDITERKRAEEKLRALQQQLESHNTYLKEEVGSALNFGRIVGRSRALRHVLQQVEDVASTGATVLITGESGTGKELLAREIHERGRRSHGPFVRVNCSAIPREMFESEFFGHVRGAFTGAMRDRPGRFQIANGGTIFLDEIGELPADLQPKLLRVLQEGEYERVGEDVTRKVDVRVITATNKNLIEEVRANRFRQDLFYRLNVFPLELPSLRARTDDIPLLASHFIVEVSKKLGMQPPTMTQADAALLQQYNWPGNIRELHNVIERAVILSKGIRLRLDIALADLAGTAASRSDVPGVILTDREFRDHERANLMKALERADGRIYGKGGAAELLGINPTTLASRLRVFKITPARSR